MHGFNRLGGNSVAETVVAGMIVGDSMADFCESDDGALHISTTLVESFGRAERQRLDAIAASRGGESAFELTRLMQDTMTEQVGIFRHGDRLQKAVSTLRDLQRRARNITLRSSAPGANPELVAAYRLQRMLKLAQCVAYGALQRTESRGAHYRADYPQRNDRDWMLRTLATWPDTEVDLPVLTYQTLDIMRMELPPGWRGYGARDYIDHPDTARRQRGIDAVLASMGDADRHIRQEALMPFKHLLPEHLRGRNQRLGEK
jgi:fumarate reductase flavoprotein subunit